MSAHLTIGEFSKMTYLSVKALRHYHEVGLLEPAEIDSATGYRRYHSDQVVIAQAIRRFRDLGMPITRVRSVLQATDIAARNQVILDHLASMQDQLERTQQTVASLQELLSSPATSHPVDFRTLSATAALAIEASIEFDDTAWIDAAFEELHAVVERSGIVAGGPDSALYSGAFFTDGVGPVTTFVPVAADDAALHRTDLGGRVRRLDLPPTRVGVMLHQGAFSDLDQTYGALGTALAELGLGADGPIREVYLASGGAEVCWPVREGP